MNVLIGFENSGIVRDAFIAAGFNAVSVDLLPTQRPGPHEQCDIRKFMSPFSASYYKEKGYADFDLAILHPDCTYLCSSGLHWNKRRPERAAKTLEALLMIEWCWQLPIEHLCIENPQGCINTQLPYMPKPQYIHPYQFGHDASKKTGLWLRNLPPLRHTELIAPRWICCGVSDVTEDTYGCPNCEGEKGDRALPRWANQTDTGQNRLGPSKTRALDRAKTYEGIAAAMAAQWGAHVKTGQ